MHGSYYCSGKKKNACSVYSWKGRSDHHERKDYKEDICSENYLLHNITDPLEAGGNGEWFRHYHQVLQVAAVKTDEAGENGYRRCLVKLNEELEPALKAKVSPTTAVWWKGRNSVSTVRRATQFSNVNRKANNRWKNLHITNYWKQVSVFGSLTQKWNPPNAAYIFMERKGIHIIDLYKTLSKTGWNSSGIENIARSGKRSCSLPPKTGKESWKNGARRVGMPFATERWLGGMLTNHHDHENVKNFGPSIKCCRRFCRKQAKRRLGVKPRRDKLKKVIGGVTAQLNRLLQRLLVVDARTWNISPSLKHIASIFKHLVW